MRLEIVVQFGSRQLMSLVIEVTETCSIERVRFKRISSELQPQAINLLLGTGRQQSIGKFQLKLVIDFPGPVDNDDVEGNVFRVQFRPPPLDQRYGSLLGVAPGAGPVYSPTFVPNPSTGSFLDVFFHSVQGFVQTIHQDRMIS